MAETYNNIIAKGIRMKSNNGQGIEF